MPSKNVILTLSLMAACLSAHASGGSAPQVDPAPPAPVAVTPAPPPAPTTKDAFNTAKDSLAKIQGLIDAQSFNEARDESRNLMLAIRDRSGIDPKTPQVISVDVALSSDEMKLPFDSLGASKRFVISRAVKAQMNGYMLDLLNLAKRAQLLYLRASYKQMISLNKLAERDVKYFRSELLQIHAVPLFFQVSGQSEYYLAFDMEVADTAIQYEFNRELLDLALEIKEFGYNEDSFEAELDATIISKRDSHVKSFAPPPAPQKPTYSTGAFKKEDFRVQEVKDISPEIVALIEPSYRGNPISEWSLKKDKIGSGWALKTGFAAVICRSMDYPNSAVGTDGLTYEADYTVKQTAIDLDLQGETSGDVYNVRYGDEDQSHMLADSYRVKTVYCQK